MKIITTFEVCDFCSTGIHNLLKGFVFDDGKLICEECHNRELTIIEIIAMETT